MPVEPPIATKPARVNDRDGTFGAPSLPRMRQAIDGMPDAQSRIGKYILDNPEKVVRSSLAELAVLAQSGEASVVRFCKQIGYAGYRDFKIALTAELASQRSVRRQGGVAVGGLAPLASRLSNAINSTAQDFDAELLSSLAARLKNSRRIDIFGVGVSGIVAEMVAYRLMRVGLVAQAFQDATLAHEVMTTFDGSCVAIGISELGLTPATVRFLGEAKASGAFTLAITGRAKSPLTQNADATLLAASVNPPPVGGEIMAVPAKILLAEALAVAITAL